MNSSDEPLVVKCSAWSVPCEAHAGLRWTYVRDGEGEDAEARVLRWCPHPDHRSESFNGAPRITLLKWDRPDGWLRAALAQIYDGRPTALDLEAIENNQYVGALDVGDEFLCPGLFAWARREGVIAYALPYKGHGGPGGSWEATLTKKGLGANAATLVAALRLLHHVWLTDGLPGLSVGASMEVLCRDREATAAPQRSSPPAP
jgi:hypothetical protein